MGRRRQFGAVRRLTSGRWQARYRDPTGRMVAAPHPFPTKGDASRWLSTIEADQARGHWVAPVAGKVTLAEYAWAWWHAKTNLAPRTKEIYETQLRLHILPAPGAKQVALGDLSLNQLTPELIRDWYATLTETRSRSVAAKAYVRLRQILEQAVNDDRIPKNPCRIPAAGAERHPEQRHLSMGELLDLVDAMPDRYQTLVLTAGLAGLRQGELFALRRSDIDLEAATITVRRQRVRLASGNVIEYHPKTDAGRRTVALSAPLVAALRQHLDAYVADEPDAYVYTSATGLPLDRHNFRVRVWQPATRRVGLDGLRFHDLRHTAGTLAAHTGATTKELMARFGHNSPRAALIYQHATTDRDRRIAERLAAMTRDVSRNPSEGRGLA